MKNGAKLAAAAGCVVALAVIAACAVKDHEPRYDGYTMRDGLGRATPEAREAMFVLGTNNLPLLVRRLSYDPQKDAFARLYGRLPIWFRQRRVLYEFASRGNVLADNSQGVLQALCTNAAPALPKLQEVLNTRGGLPARRALEAMGYMGEKGLDVILLAASDTNHPLRVPAIESVGRHSRSGKALLVLSNALQDPDPGVRNAAAQALTNTPASYYQ